MKELVFSPFGKEWLRNRQNWHDFEKDCNLHVAINNFIQVSQAQLSGVQECRSDASLRSVDDSNDYDASSTFVYTPTLLPSTLLSIVYTPTSYTPDTSLLAKLE